MPASKILVVSPHPDDCILGAGGTMARMASAGADVFVFTVTTHQPPIYDKTIHRQTVDELRDALGVIGVKELTNLDKPALLLCETPHHELNNILNSLFCRVCPDILLLPHADRHIDHSIVFESAMVACRPLGACKEISMIAAYECISGTFFNAPQFDSVFSPNWFVDIGGVFETKIDLFARCKSQVQPSPHPCSLDSVETLARFRGGQIGVEAAEAFQVIRQTVAPETIGSKVIVRRE